MITYKDEISDEEVANMLLSLSGGAGDENEVTSSEYDVLLIEGASTKAFIILGALQYAWDNGLIQKINKFVGVSSGSMISYLLCLGYSPKEMMAYICTNQVVEKLPSFNISSLLNNKGLSSFEPVERELEVMTMSKVGVFLTLKELKDKYGKELHVVTYNMSKKTPVYITPDSHPDLPCITAIRMSSTLPFIFDQYFYEGSYYIDGGICDNFPVVHAEKYGSKVLGIRIKTEEKENKKEEKKEDTEPEDEFHGDALSLITCGVSTGGESGERESGEYGESGEREDEKGCEKVSLLDSIYQIMLVPIDQVINLQVMRAKPCTSIMTLNFTENVKFYTFDVDISVKLNLFSSGYKEARKFFTGQDVESL